MADAGNVRSNVNSPAKEVRVATRAEELERRTEELIAFRDAGVLTEVELEEQKAKLRWGLD